ncbi:hypothetical protein [Streptomyces sp. NPDC005538]
MGAVLAAYYGGRIRQWWLSRHERKTAEAITHIAGKFSPKGDKA